jgi:hypothetical protein
MLMMLTSFNPESQNCQNLSVCMEMDGGICVCVYDCFGEVVENNPSIVSNVSSYAPVWLCAAVEIWNFRYQY